ncbi:hypothetical protein Cassandra_0455 [Pseudomonas phage Cassandra]|nr:hypothetical protein Cassandra_0455 [Pseudomonas phage Cassandra]
MRFIEGEILPFKPIDTKFKKILNNVLNKYPFFNNTELVIDNRARYSKESPAEVGITAKDLAKSFNINIIDETLYDTQGNRIKRLKVNKSSIFPNVVRIIVYDFKGSGDSRDIIASDTESSLTRISNIGNNINTISESYTEGKHSTLTHNGNEYRLDDIFRSTEHAPVESVKIKDLTWILRYTKLAPSRVKAADVSIPIIVYKDNGKLYVIDGAHRLTKARDNKNITINAKYISKQQLDKAKIETNKKEA